MIVAFAVFVASAKLAACTITVAGTGNDLGAVKTPVVEIVPTVEFPPGIPATLQLTPAFAVFATVGVKVIAFPRSTEPLAGVTLTDIEFEAGASVETRPTTPAHPAQSAIKSAIAGPSVPNIWAGILPDILPDILNVPTPPFRRVVPIRCL